MSEMLLIRADAGPQIGLGHVMRCVAIAEAWRRAGDPVGFVSHAPPRDLRDRLQQLGCECYAAGPVPGGDQDAVECSRLARALGARWVVVDGYHFGDRYQRQLKEAGLRLLAVDDHGHAAHYWADLVLNQTEGTDPARYANREAYTRLLLGARFVLLRREFLKWRDWQRPIPKTARRALVTLGGSDFENVTRKILEGWPGGEALPLETTLVIGPGNPHQAALEAAARAHPAMRVVRAPPNLPELMAEADLGVTAGGITAWEMAFMGLPQLTVILAENQRANAGRIQAEGAGRNLGWHEHLTGDQLRERVTELCGDFDERSGMSRQGRLLVDGYGAARVWFHLNESRLALRPARPEDCRQVWEWANDPEVRAVSFTQARIPWADHVKWFERKLADAQCRLFMAADSAGEPVGQVRFDLDEAKAAVISISLDRSSRGRGYGGLLIWSACRKLFAETAVERVHAWIKPENRASIAAFQRAGFKAMGSEQKEGSAAGKFLLARPTDAE